MTTTRSTRSLRSKLTFGTLLAVAMLATLTTSADARWIRGLSDISSYGDDISVCADEVTIGFELVHQFDSYEAFYPVPTLGEPYPGLNPQSVALYGSAADAVAQSNELVTFSIPINYAGISGGGYQFLGQTTLPTPAAYGNGDVLYAYSFDFDIGSAVGVPLTVGDPVYDCAPSDLAWGVLAKVPETVLVNSPLLHTIIFDATEVNPKTLVVTAPTGPAAKVDFLGSIGPFGVARVNLNETALGCSTETLRLAGTDSGGYPYEREIKVVPVGGSCSS